MIDPDINDPDKIKLAKLTSKESGLLRNTNCGPLLMINYGEEERAKNLIQNQVACFEAKDYPADGIIDLPSAWHAAIFLENVVSNYLSKGERLIFRGQSNIKWPIISSINRDDVTDEERLRETYTMMVFTDLLASMPFSSISAVLPPGVTRSPSSFPDVRISPGSYRAAAQHYDIKTDLIDWTPDPSVATFFASLKQSSALASVFVMKISDAFENGFEILVPPPYIERLHLQRGFFIHGSHEGLSAEKIRSLCFMEVRFPENKELGKYDVYRKGIGLMDLLPKEPFFDLVIAQAKQIVDTLIIKDHAGQQSVVIPGNERYRNQILWGSIYLRKDLPFNYINYYEFWEKYLEHFEQILFWTCYLETQEGYFLEEDVFKRIMSSNFDLGLSVFKLWKYFLSNPTYWDEIKAKRIKVFVNAAETLFTDVSQFKTTTVYESLKERIKNNPMEE